MRRILVIFVLLSGIVSITTTHDAAACTTGHLPEANTVPPPLGVRAPINVRPRVKLHADWRSNAFCSPFGERCAQSKGRKFDLELRAAGTTREPIPSSQRESPMGDLTTVEIIPRAHLPANMRFEIIYVEVDGKEAPRIIATFTTGDKVDDTPPEWKGVTNHSLRAWPGVVQPAGKKGGGVIRIDMCPDQQGIDFYAPERPTDEATRFEDIRYGIWIGEPGKDIDYATSPRTYSNSTQYFGRPGSQYKMIVAFDGQQSDLSLPTGKKVVKFGFRAIDLAGNYSTLSEIVVTVP